MSKKRRKRGEIGAKEADLDQVSGLGSHQLLPCVTWAWSGMVVRVSDGGTIKVMQAHKKVKVRLYRTALRRVNR